MRFKGKSVRVTDVEEFDWSQVQLALFSAGAETSDRWAPVAADFGVVVIDNTSRFRYEHDVPLVIPEVNPHALAEYRNRNIIANPNCSTIQMLVALKPIHEAYGIERINVATYQSVSGSGKKGVDELAGQTAKLLNGLPAENKAYDKQIAFNCLPHIDDFMDNGYTKEEMKMVWETQKILGDDNIRVNPTCVRVPVFFMVMQKLSMLKPVSLSMSRKRSACLKMRKVLKCSMATIIRLRLAMRQEKTMLWSPVSVKTSAILAA